MGEDVYVWQRVWTEDVRAAVDERRGEFGRCVVLGVEMDFSEAGGWRVDYFEDPLRYVSGHEGVDVAVRIGAGAAVLGWDDGAIRRVVEVVGRMREGAVVQLDYDCPTSKLGGYVRLLERLRTVFPERRFEVTCLPDWLGEDDFEGLIGLVDGYVMQVHGVSGYGGGRMLCDAVYAKRVAERCEGFGKDFWIALPTYRHAVRRGEDGRVQEVISEGGRLRGGSAYEMMGADVVELSGLVRDWVVDRPGHLRGLIWYRLPVVGDRMNWTWDTFCKVRAGEVPVGELRVEAVGDDAGFYALFLVNDSKMRLSWPDGLKVSWGGALAVGVEGSGEFLVGDLERQMGVDFVWRARDPRPISPGARVKVGWVRLDGEVDLIFDLKL